MDEDDGESITPSLLEVSDAEILDTWFCLGKSPFQPGVRWPRYYVIFRDFSATQYPDRLKTLLMIFSRHDRSTFFFQDPCVERE